MVIFGQGEGTVTLRGLEGRTEGPLWQVTENDSGGSFHDKSWEHLMTHQVEHLGTVQFL